MLANCELEEARCECCGLEVPYLSLAMVRVERPMRRVGGWIIFEPQVFYQLECEECRAALLT